MFKCSYCQPKSLTWWSGVFSVAMGLAMMFNLNHPAFGVFGEVIMAMAGGAGAVTPASLILTGLAVIGLRAKQERG